MLATQIVKLIEIHAEALAHDVVEDLLTNAHTPTFRSLPRGELEPRIRGLYEHLGTWIDSPNDHAIRAEYEYLGRVRYRQGIPVSEILYSLILTKKHLRAYIQEYGLIDSTGDRTPHGETIPLGLYSIQQLNYAVGDFFDRALYFLILGYELQAKESLYELRHQRVAELSNRS